MGQKKRNSDQTFSLIKGNDVCKENNLNAEQPKNEISEKISQSECSKKSNDSNENRDNNKSINILENNDVVTIIDDLSVANSTGDNKEFLTGSKILIEVEGKQKNINEQTSKRIDNKEKQELNEHKEIPVQKKRNSDQTFSLIKVNDVCKENNLNAEQPKNEISEKISQSECSKKSNDSNENRDNNKSINILENNDVVTIIDDLS